MLRGLSKVSLLCARHSFQFKFWIGKFKILVIFLYGAAFWNTLSCTNQTPYYLPYFLLDRTVWWANVSHDTGDPGSIPGLGRSPGEGNGNPLQYSCLENPMDGAAWWAIVNGVAKSQTQLSDFTSLMYHKTLCKVLYSTMSFEIWSYYNSQQDICLVSNRMPVIYLSVWTHHFWGWYVFSLIYGITLEASPVLFFLNCFCIFQLAQIKYFSPDTISCQWLLFDHCDI